MKGEATVKSVRLNDTIIENIYKLAKKENRNFSNMVETLLLKALKDANKD